MHRQVSYYVFKGLGDGLTGVPPFHNHGSLHILNQLGRSVLQEALGALRLGLSENTHKHRETWQMASAAYCCINNHF